MSRFSSVESDLHITISQQIIKNADIGDLLKRELPDHLSNLSNNLCSVSELIEIQSFIDLNTNKLKNNVTIGIRLSGGIAMFSKKSGIAIGEIERLLNSGNFEELVCSLAKVTGRQETWFSEGRVFYNERQISNFRRQNLAMLVGCIDNYPSFVELLSQELGRIKTHYVKVLEGANTPHGSRIGRLLEQILGIQAGALDLPQDKFERVLKMIE
ncbi:hypothetical protein VIBNISOn1_190027 [Vibrio nigripulchritudo SOn1]|uniref:Uncharacterized protein n=1 Tax=Vibrio nigripulchritudo SOn1 TaxID=1238450 RepID=A0AAV2VQU8_9VIBR|nr:hypothetical protein [Vibrio nigripulchritudo]CCO46808.1 hypothetical protein VIBNISOn1_190027 [Vibrio nigripulchritudo SOn1]